MDNLTPPLGAPHASTMAFFIGFIRSGLEREGYINANKWNEALKASEEFRQDQMRRHGD